MWCVPEILLRIAEPKLRDPVISPVMSSMASLAFRFEPARGGGHLVMSDMVFEFAVTGLTARRAPPGEVVFREPAIQGVINRLAEVTIKIAGFDRIEIDPTNATDRHLCAQRKPLPADIVERALDIGPALFAPVEPDDRALVGEMESHRIEQSPCIVVTVSHALNHGDEMAGDLLVDAERVGLVTAVDGTNEAVPYSLDERHGIVLL